MNTQGRTEATSQGKQHFSHPHVLKPINPAELGLNLTCIACEQQNKSNSFYGCRSCQYFLHEDCFNAPRFLDHSFHPFHPLSLFPIPTYPSRSFTCDACGSASNGFCFSCACCGFDLHLHCALLPQTVFVPQHHHELKITSGSTFDESTYFSCDICYNKVDCNYWLYYCADCDFGTHLECGTSNLITMKPKEEPIRKQETNSFHYSAPNMKHFSHPHTLEIFEAQETDEIICSCCELKLSGSSFKCTKPNCEFNLHRTCFELPRKIQHNSHHKHPLTLYPSHQEQEYSYYFGCNACGEEPKAFVYECTECSFSLHANCAISWPETVTREDHQHPLTLQHKWPFPLDDYERLFCEVCNGLCVDSLWLYYCAECKFSTHLGCATVKKEEGSSLENEEEEEEEEEGEMTNAERLLRATIKAQGQQARLNFQAQMAYQNAQFISNLWRSHHRYY